jgi:hypothetical protein
MEGRWFGGRNPRLTDHPPTVPLTDVKIRQAKATAKALKLADTAGLYLEVKPNGAKLWRYRYRIAGRENLYAIGDYQHHRLGDVCGATLLVGVSLARLYAPLVVTARLLWRCRTRGQVDRAMAIAKCRARGRPLLRRVK